MVVMNHFEIDGVHMKTHIRLAAPLIAISVAAAGAVFAQSGDQLGKVQFPNSCSPAVQEKLLRGVAMLHPFFYSAAEQAFEEFAAQDNSCAIAACEFGSILMSNPLQVIGASLKNVPRAQAAINKVRKMSAKTERERDYLEAVAACCEDFADRPERAPARARRGLQGARGQLPGRRRDHDSSLPPRPQARKLPPQILAVVNALRSAGIRASSRLTLKKNATSHQPICSRRSAWSSTSRTRRWGGAVLALRPYGP